MWHVEMAEKRKRILLDLTKKFEIVQRLRNGEKASDLAKAYGVGRTTISDLKRDGDKIEEFVNNMDVNDGEIAQRKTMKCPTYTKLDIAMYQWCMEQRRQGVALSGAMITQKALTTNAVLNGDPSFKASSGWLDKFKTRHGIRHFSFDAENKNDSSSCHIPDPSTAASAEGQPTSPPTNSGSGMAMRGKSVSRSAPQPARNIPLNPTDLYSLLWPEYSTKFSGSFSTLWEAQDLVDVTLGVDGRYIQAHKLVLSVCSDYFKELFKINPCQHPIVLLKDVDYESMHALVQFMYCGEVQISADKLPTLLRIAQQLKVKGLINEEGKPQQIPSQTTGQSQPVFGKPPAARGAKTTTPNTAACPVLEDDKPFIPGNTATTTPDKTPAKRARYTIPSNVNVKVLRRAPPEGTMDSWNTTSPGGDCLQPTNHNFINPPRPPKQDISTFNLENIAGSPGRDDNSLDIMETDFVEMIPIKLEHEVQDGEEEIDQHFEFVSDIVKEEIGLVEVFQYETIEESGSEYDEEDLGL